MENGFVLSGGGALGIAHIGYLKVLEGKGITPDCITGTSMGAIIGGLRAFGLSPQEIERIVLKIDKKLMRKLIDISLVGGLLKTNDIHKFLRSIVGDIKIEELKIHFVAVAVDSIEGKLLYITKGRLVDAMIASMSIPIIFEGFKTKKEILVDGGLRENFPINAMKKIFNPDKIYASVVMQSTDFVWKEEIYNIPKMNMKFSLIDWFKSSFKKYKNIKLQLDKTLSIILDEANKRTIIENKDVNIIIIKPVTEKIDFLKGKIIIENGEKTTLRNFKDNFFTS